TGNAVGLDDGKGALERHAGDSLWGQKGARLYRSNAKTASNPLKFNAEWMRGPASDGEALSTPALALGVRIVEPECLVEALFDEVDRGALDQRQALGVDEHLHAVI